MDLLFFGLGIKVVSV